MPLPGIAACELPVTDPSTPDDDETVIECDECGHEIEEGEGYHVGDRTLCRDCTCHCEHCETAFCTNDDDAPNMAHRDAHASSRSEPDTYLCDDCSFECADCNRRFSDRIGNRENASGDRICGRCEENYSSCEGCNCILHTDDTHITDDATYCESCYRENVNENKLVHDYSYKPSPTFQTIPGEKRLSTTMFMGWELEVDNGRTENDDAIERADFPEWYYCKEDGSLSTGFEIVTHPATWKFWQADGMAFAKSLKDDGFRSYNTTTCGMHVHVSKRSLSQFDQLKLLELFKLNPSFIRYVSRRREENLTRWAAIDDVARTGLIRKVKRGNDHDTRYTALNFENANTIEFRIFRGTLDVPAIKRNLAFVYALCQYVKQAGLNQLTFELFGNWLATHGKGIVGERFAKPLIQWVYAFNSSPYAADAAETDVEQCA